MTEIKTKNDQILVFSDMQKTAIPKKQKPSLWQDLQIFFDAEGWEYQVFGRASFPKEITTLDDWTIVPSALDASEIPDHAMSKVMKIYLAGFRPKGFLLIHENDPNSNETVHAQPYTMKTPKADWFREKNVTNKNSVALDALEKTGEIAKKMVKEAKPVIKQMGEATKPIAVTAGKVAMGTAVVAGTVVVGAAAAIVGLVGALIDPVLCIVSEDYYWIEIDRWYV